MRDWITTTIGEFIDFNPSEKLQKNKIAKKIPMDKLGTFERKIKGFVFIEYQSGPKFRNNDTLVAKITPCLENGKTAFVNILDNEEVAFGSSEFIVLRNNKLSDAKFIYYLARSPYFREKAISCMEGTSGRKRVNETALKHLNIKVPPIETQQKIAKILSDIDDKIEILHQINDNLAELAKTIYDYWFVQFDFPDENGKPYKTSGGKMVYNEVLKREIPEGWEVKSLGEIEPNIITGKTPTTKDENNFNGNILFITIDDIRQNLFIYNSERTLSEKGANTQRAKFLKKGDICVSCIGTVGVIGIVGKIAQTNQQINSISNPQNFNKYFLLNYLDRYFKDNFTAKKGAVLDNMNKAEFESIIIINPIQNIKEIYYGKVKFLYKKIDTNIQQIQHLQFLRDWLLPMLMNGQISVE